MDNDIKTYIIIALAAIIIIIIITALIRSLVRKIKRTFRSAASSTINMLVKSVIDNSVNKPAQTERQVHVKERSADSGSEVRAALREQMTSCAQCGAPNTSIEDFCPYCGASLIRHDSIDLKKINP